MATHTEDVVLETRPSTSATNKKAVADLMAELDLGDQQTTEKEEQGPLGQWARALTTSPEILIMVVWIVMMYALWTQFKGPILALLK